MYVYYIYAYTVSTWRITRLGRVSQCTAAFSDEKEVNALSDTEEVGRLVRVDVARVVAEI